MDNRFGLKDFLLFALVAAVLVAVVLGMFQFDRQWDTVRQLEQQNQTLASDLNQLGRKIDRLARSGIAVSGTGGATTQAAVDEDDPFRLIDEAEQNEDFARGGWFLDNFGTKIGRLTPLVSSDVYASWVQNLVLESLVQRDPYTMEWQPKLAESWEVSDDGLEMTFHLREGIRFSDGEPMTADDVVFTFDSARNPEVQADRVRAYMEQLDTVEAVDDQTVKFTFSEPYFQNFETAATMPVLPRHFYEKFSPTQFNEGLGLLVGSGPYLLPDAENWSPTQDVTVVRNPRYWGPPATFDRMNFKQVQEEAAEEVMFRNGELDRYGASPENFDKLKADPDIGKMATSFSYDTVFGGYTYIGWNQSKLEDGQEIPTIFADKRVRQAMTMLVDRKRLADDLYAGYATVANGPFSPTGPQSAPDVEAWPYDVDRAVALLNEAGWDDRNGDGVLEDGDGNMLRFTLAYSGGNQFTEKIVLALQDMFARGGVLMELERLDWPALIERLQKGTYEATTLGWSSGPESDPYQIFHSSQAKVGGDNRSGYKSPEFDAAVDDARTTMDEDERMQKWHEVHRILHEDQPYTFLLNRQSLRFFNNRIKNVKTSPMGLNYEAMNGGALPWYIPTSQQRAVN